MDVSARREAFRLLPSVDELLRHPRIVELEQSLGRDQVRAFCQEALEELRSAILSDRLEGEELDRELSLEAVTQRIAGLAQRDGESGLGRVVNASGVVLHTGLGRAPVHPEVAERMAEMARSYCTLEIDRESGQRGVRDARLSELLSRLTGAEAGICVNNCAGAVLLTLSTFAGGREAIVSRGELVEIGGSFRMPDVMKAVNAKLVEVGTTNRTRVADYRSRVGPDTGLLLKVHTSNFRVVGFTEEVSERELGELGTELGVPSAFDLGSGLYESPELAPLDFLAGEPRIKEAVESGVDVVMFSGDKLLGAPQAGLLVGKKETIQRLRKNPVYRAVRLDKATLAGLEATIEMLVAGRGAELPTRRMLTANKDEVGQVAERLAGELCAHGSLSVRVLDSDSQPGSGSAPTIYIPTRAVAVRHESLSAGELARALRLGEPSVWGRVQDDQLILDPRTFLEGDFERVVAAFRTLLG